MSIAPRINIVTLGVANVATATAFYERLGFCRSSASNESITFLKTNGTVLALFRRDALAQDAGVENGASGFSGITLAHNLASEAEVDAAFAHAVASGATAVKQPHKVFWGGYSGYFADPDGHLWELAFNPYAPFDDKGNLVLPD